MSTMTISLPDTMTDWIEEQVQAGDYSSPSDYVRDLVARDRDDKQKLSGLRQLIDEAEAGGLSSRTLDDIFAEARATTEQHGR